MSVNVALTGATGNMGRASLDFLSREENVGKIYCLCQISSKKAADKLKKQYGDKIEFVFGDMADEAVCAKLVQNAQYVVHMAAVIPPKSDRNPALAEKVNFRGTQCLVDAVAALRVQPKFIHISTMALYGDRNYKHLFGRVGDPLMPSPYDPYAMSKLVAERYVLESSLQKWVVIRQTAMLHYNMLSANLSDGLMFHTCYNAPLEWVTSTDSGRLIANIIKQDSQCEQPDFWHKVFNLGGGEGGRNTGYEVFEGGFRIIGGSTEKFLKPNWNALRNFHGLWFSDSYILEDMFRFRRDTLDGFWQQIAKRHPYYKLGKILPPKLISAMLIKPLLKDPNAPAYWEANGDEGRVFASFGDTSPSKLSSDWKQFPLLCKGVAPDGTKVDYAQLKKDESATFLSHGYDESKRDGEIDVNDLKQAAAFRGGDLLTTDFKKGDLYRKLQWRCHDGHVFTATAYTVLKTGHWCPECVKPYVWDYDRLSKDNPFYAQVWYDAHGREENKKYSLDENYKTRFEQCEQ